ncbi:MAG: DUF1249 domain-containing protein [Gammaproteobacteria bacterium]|nr:MAG: DUF1249 domain-containing protein [Gammaproteobacteria bacterium]
MFTLRVINPQPHYVTYRERYRVDLPLQMAECETNYVRLQKLLVQHFNKPTRDQTGDEYRFMVSRGEQQWLHQLRILERSPYTTTLQLSQTTVANISTWLRMPRLTVRMYHDAKLAEVLAWEGHKRLRPRYEYPNQSMYHADEKLQINQFLGELLTRCLSEGHQVDDVKQFLGL